MRLVDALRLKLPQISGEAAPPCLAFVGAGGKTTAMFYLAGELIERGYASVLVSTTTHLAVEQAAWGDYHYVIRSLEEVEILEAGLPPGISVITGEELPDQRLRGLDEVEAQKLFTVAGRFNSPLLIEADGSRLHPLKAPAVQEPAIPTWVNMVIIVAGLTGLGKPLSTDVVHRPEAFASLSGLETGEMITTQALVRVLSSPQGGLKNIPGGARRIVLLNQAGTPELQADAQRIADDLLQTYDSILAADLKGEGEKILAVYERTAGVVLAAGEASRFGRPKQFLDWEGESFVRKVAQTALSSGLDPVLLVTGAYDQDVQAEVNDLPVQVIHNPNWQDGQGTSVACGTRALPGHTGAAIFLLADQPQVTPTLLRSLIELHARTLAPITAPLIDGQRGNPVLFDRASFPDLRSLAGEQGGRALFSRYPVTWLPWHDARLLIDVDTEEDYLRLLGGK